jgi:hypothetical protein
VPCCRLASIEPGFDECVNCDRNRGGRINVLMTTTTALSVTSFHWLAPPRKISLRSRPYRRKARRALANSRSVVVSLHGAIGFAGRIDIIGCLIADAVVRPTERGTAGPQPAHVDRRLVQDRPRGSYSFFRGIVSGSFMLVGTTAATLAAKDVVFILVV